MYLTAEQRRRIDGLRRRAGLTLAEIVRRALDDYFEGRFRASAASSGRESAAGPAPAALEPGGSRLLLGRQLLDRVAVTAAEDGATVEELVESAVEERLATRKSDISSRVTWPILPGGARQGVRIADRGALYDLMEGRD